MSNGADVVNKGEWLGHPKGLFVLFFAEMWERYCYYGMRCILIYYMMKQLMFAQDKASQIYGLYTSASYFIPFFGGIIADRWLGQRRSAIIGAIIMVIGEFVLMSPDLFYPGLVLMAFGTGFFKPNVSTQVGSLYAPGDHRRDRAFNIYYMGINIGAILSTFVCGTLGELYGFKWGFMSAGIGLILGLIVYLWGQKYLAPDLITKEKKEPQKVPSKLVITREDWLKIFALVVLCFLKRRLLGSLRTARQHACGVGRFEHQSHDLRLDDARHVVSKFQPADDHGAHPAYHDAVDMAGQKKQRTVVDRQNGDCMFHAWHFVPCSYAGRLGI